MKTSDTDTYPLRLVKVLHLIRAVLLAVAIVPIAQAQETEILLPFEDGTPLGLGRALVLDPTSDPANPAVLVGLGQEY